MTISKKTSFVKWLFKKPIAEIKDYIEAFRFMWKNDREEITVPLFFAWVVGGLFIPFAVAMFTDNVFMMLGLLNLLGPFFIILHDVYSADMYQIERDNRVQKDKEGPK
jgi:hypothetical protein